MVEFENAEKLEEYLDSSAHIRGLHKSVLNRIDISKNRGISYSLFPNKSLARLIDADKQLYSSVFDMNNLTQTGLLGLKNYLEFLSEHFIPTIGDSVRKLGLELVYVGEEGEQYADIVPFYEFNLRSESRFVKCEEAKPRPMQFISRVGIGKVTNTTSQHIDSLLDILTGKSEFKLEDLKAVRKYREEDLPK